MSLTVKVDVGHGESLQMSLTVQGHHGLMEGIHLGRFHARAQAYLGEPETVLGEG